MHPDQIWGNDEKYSKEFQIAFRERCEKERQKNEEYWKNYVDPNADKYEAGRRLTQEMDERRARGEITNPFVKNWMEGEIAAARIALVVGICLTALFKGQIVMWAIMYFAYRGRVNRIKQEALEADRRGYKK